jgi:Zn finger protein HypA/HybF involved in hydrogenase expression
MARFCCRDCSSEGTFTYAGTHECPKCGSRNVQFALSIEELSDDDPLIVALTKLADDDT